MKGWTLADVLDDDQFDRLLTEAERALRRFATAEGAVVCSVPAHIVTAAKPGAEVIVARRMPTTLLRVSWSICSPRINGRSQLITKPLDRGQLQSLCCAPR